MAMRRRGLFQLVKDTVNGFSEDDCPTMAAALSYYTVFSLPPLLVLLLTILGAVMDPQDIQGNIEAQIRSAMGPSGAEQDFAQQDDLYEQAVRFIVESGHASISLLQRRLRVGHARAARLIDMMEQDGILGPPQGSKPREVLVKGDYFEEMASWKRGAGAD